MRKAITTLDEFPLEERETSQESDPQRDVFRQVYAWVGFVVIMALAMTGFWTIMSAVLTFINTK